MLAQACQFLPMQIVASICTFYQYTVGGQELNTFTERGGLTDLADIRQWHKDGAFKLRLKLFSMQTKKLTPNQYHTMPSLYH